MEVLGILSVVAGDEDKEGNDDGGEKRDNNGEASEDTVFLRG